MGIEFEFFEAGCGDSILVSTDEGTHILIDGGEEGTYRESIEPTLYDKNIDKIDLVVLTHIDNDHICGFIEMLEDKDGVNKIQEIWFNSYDGMKVQQNMTGEIGFREGDLFEELIKEYDITHRKNIFLPKGVSLKDREFSINADIKFTLLSPQKTDLDKLEVKWDKFRENSNKDIAGKSPFDNRNIEDVYSEFQDTVLKKTDKTKTLSSATNTSSANRSSIAFILEYQEKKFLFLGDADIKVITKSLLALDMDNLEFEFIKLSHHGSKSNINQEFLHVVKTDKFIILTDGSRHRHPDKETIALILKHKNRSEEIQFIFNYAQPIDYKFLNNKNEKNSYNFRALHENTLEF